MAEKMQILLSIDWQASHLALGDRVTAGILCMDGSAMYFMSTGMSLRWNSRRQVGIAALAGTDAGEQYIFSNPVPAY